MDNPENAPLRLGNSTKGTGYGGIVGVGSGPFRCDDGCLHPLGAKMSLCDADCGVGMESDHVTARLDRSSGQMIWSGLARYAVSGRKEAPPNGAQTALPFPPIDAA